VKELIKRALIRLHLQFLLHLYYRLPELQERVRTAYWRLLMRLNIEVERDIRYDLETIDVMRRMLKKDSNCIDVGCNRGDLLREILKLAPQGTHYAFEPIPELFKGLTALFPKVNISNVALSDTKGVTTFYDVVSCRAYSGLQGRHLEQTEDVRQITVPTDRLDDIVPADVPIRLIKVDVEGAELLVLRGAVNTIRRNKPVIIFEHGLGGAEFFNSTPRDIYDLLVKECDLRISVMKDWLRHRPPLTREQFTSQFEQHKNYMFMAHLEANP